MHDAVVGFYAQIPGILTLGSVPGQKMEARVCNTKSLSTGIEVEAVDVLILHKPSLRIKTEKER